jgi:hypothetical protein
MSRMCSALRMASEYGDGAHGEAHSGADLPVETCREQDRGTNPASTLCRRPGGEGISFSAMFFNCGSCEKDESVK